MTNSSSLNVAAVLACSLLCPSAGTARPPNDMRNEVASSSKIAGRLRLHSGEVVDLSVETLAEGGPAADVARGVAVQADAKVTRHERQNDARARPLR